MICLTGTLTCASPDEAALVLAGLPEHVRLTRAEPGCLSFTVTRIGQSLTWKVDESFATRADFDAHQVRTRASDWYRTTGHIARDFAVTEVDPGCP